MLQHIKAPIYLMSMMATYLGAAHKSMLRFLSDGHTLLEKHKGYKDFFVMCGCLITGLGWFFN